MWKLDSCDIYRYGGSLGAVLSQGTKHVSLFLQIVPWDKPPKICQYRSLWVSEGQIPDCHGEEVTAASEVERDWLYDRSPIRLRKIVRGLSLKTGDCRRKPFARPLQSLVVRSNGQGSHSV